MHRALALAYGFLAYALFLATFLYAVGFLAGVGVPKSIDTGDGGSPGTALLVDLALLGLFAVQHSLMARPWFKRSWTRIVPAPVERSTYVLLSSACLILLFWLWQPLPGRAWTLEAPAGVALLWAAYAVGWLLILVSTFLIDHFDLFGLRQVVRYFRGASQAPPPFQARLFYRVVRHPLMLGWLVVFWSTPRMSAGHLLFALTTTLYILAAIQIEERDLLRSHGDSYVSYRQRVPMLLPWPKRPGLLTPEGALSGRGPRERVP